MRITKSQLAVSTAAAVTGVILVSGTVSAARPTSGTSLVDKIAARFNLNRADVQKVFDDNKSEHHAKREASYEDRLSKAVTDGKLTADQKAKIIAEHQKLEAELKANTSTDQADRRTQMQAIKAEAEAWEKANNIPSGYLRLGGRRPMFARPSASN